MTKEKARKLRLIYGICLSVFTVVIGGLFILQLLRIYYSGPDKPYSYELVSMRLKQIIIPVILWAAAVVGGAVIWAIYPEEEKLVAATDEKTTLEKLEKRLPDCGEEYANELQALRKSKKTRKLMKWVCVGLCLLSTVMCLVYLLDFSNYPIADNGAHVTDEVLRMAWAVMPWLIACFILCIAATVYEMKLIKKETLIVKTLIAENAKKGNIVKISKAQTTKKSFWQTEKFLMGMRIALALCAVVCIVVGVCNGGMKDVFAKAIKICTECIGLG